MKVPSNKTVYIRSRKYVEGEELPGGVYIEIDDKPVKKQSEKKSDDSFNFGDSE